MVIYLLIYPKISRRILKIIETLAAAGKGTQRTAYPFVDVESVTMQINTTVKFKNHNDNYGGKKNQMEKVIDRLHKCRDLMTVNSLITDAYWWNSAEQS